MLSFGSSIQPIKANEISLDEASSTFPLFPAGKSGPDSSRKWRCLVKACLDFQERRRRRSLSRFLSRYHILVMRFIRNSIFDFSTLNFPQDRFVTMTISLRHEFLEKYGSPPFSSTVFESYLESFSFFFEVLAPIFEKLLQRAANEVYQNSHDNTQLYIQNTIVHTLHFYRGIFCSHLQLSSLLPSFFNLVTATSGKELRFFAIEI